MEQLQIKSPPAVQTDAVGLPLETSGNIAHRPTKHNRILAELARGRSLNRFEAEHIGDHCLHSTVARIESRGVRVGRRMETVPGYGGNATRVCRYRLDDENRKRAAALLGKEWHHGT